jgi:hypothetical protein
VVEMGWRILDQLLFEEISLGSTIDERYRRLIRGAASSLPTKNCFYTEVVERFLASRRLIVEDLVSTEQQSLLPLGIEKSSQAIDSTPKSHWLAFF